MNTSCKTEGCEGLGKLTLDGKRQFLKGYCNACYQRENRKRDTSLAVYYKMVNRCSNPRSDSYPRYGARGIKVALAWLPENGGFRQFKSDMGERPSMHHTLDRIDNDGPYSPENCRWALIHAQANNRDPKRSLGADTFYPDPFRGVTLRQYKHKNGKIYTNKKSHWCASIWYERKHIRIY